MTDCKFDHNRGPARISITHRYARRIIHFTRTWFVNGTGNKDNSGGLQVDVTQGGAVNSTRTIITISDCKFDSNSGQNGSHLLIK